MARYRSYASIALLLAALTLFVDSCNNLATFRLSSHPRHGESILYRVIVSPAIRGECGYILAYLWHGWISVSSISPVLIRLLNVSDKQRG
eukprot:6491678-Amphidinium_carterae.1